MKYLVFFFPGKLHLECCNPWHPTDSGPYRDGCEGSVPGARVTEGGQGIPPRSPCSFDHGCLCEQSLP